VLEQNTATIPQLYFDELLTEHDEQSCQDFLLSNHLRRHAFFVKVEPPPCPCTWRTQDKKLRLAVLYNVSHEGSITLFPEIPTRAKVGRYTAKTTKFTL